jgi:sigma-B regulation protein RsbU (phosphoserine phosphatase)
MQKAKRILVVDDNFFNRKMLSDLFAHHGFDVCLAADGAAALQHLEKCRFDIIITDYMMPEMNGIEFIRKARPLCGSAFIIGVSSDGVDKEFLSAGADIFMSKPLDIQMMLDIVMGDGIHLR